MLPGADIIAQRIERAVSQSSQETLDATVVEAIVDLSVERLGNTHLKVSLTALSTLLSILSRADSQSRASPGSGRPSWRCSES